MAAISPSTSTPVHHCGPGIASLLASGHSGTPESRSTQTTRVRTGCISCSRIAGLSITKGRHPFRPMSDIGVGSANTVAHVVIANPYILNNPVAGGGARAMYFVRAGNANKVEIHSPNQGAMANFTKFLAVTGTQTVDVLLTGHSDLSAYATIDQLSTGVVRLHGQYYGIGATYIDNPLGRLYVRKGTSADFYLSAFNPGWFSVDQPGRTPGSPTILSLRNRWQTGTAAPTTNTWAQGDRMMNQLPTELGTAGNKYVITGWVCVVAGTPGTWLEMHATTGN